MSVAVKICGIKDFVALEAAIDGGAGFAGFVFIANSRRLITPEQASVLARKLPPHIQAVGLFIDPTDDDIVNVIQHVPLKIIQLHGHETPERMAEIRNLTGLKVMKAIHIAAEDDFAKVPAYEAVADMLLFDTKIGNAPTGGTGQSFDWSLLKGKTFAKPWMLAGGLNIDNVAEAVKRTGAQVIDLSSGVEDAYGRKDAAKIRALLELTSGL